MFVKQFKINQNKMEKTAVEFLESQYRFLELTKTDFDQANEKFEKQIKDAFEHGDMVGRASMVRELNSNDKVVLKYPEISAEQYYKETFKSE